MNRRGNRGQAKEQSERSMRCARVSYTIGALFWATLIFLVFFTLFYCFFYYVVDYKLH